MNKEMSQTFENMIAEDRRLLEEAARGTDGQARVARCLLALDSPGVGNRLQLWMREEHHRDPTYPPIGMYADIGLALANALLPVVLGAKSPETAICAVLFSTDQHLAELLSGAVKLETTVLDTKSGHITEGTLEGFLKERRQS